VSFPPFTPALDTRGWALQCPSMQYRCLSRFSLFPPHTLPTCWSVVRVGQEAFGSEHGWRGEGREHSKPIGQNKVDGTKGRQPSLEAIPLKPGTTPADRWARWQAETR
jgi:hypothetical protein